LRGIGTVTKVGMTTRVAVATAATATVLVVGVVGVVLVVDDRRRAASNITSPSLGGSTPSATQSAPTPSPTRTVPQPPPLLLPNMRSLSASDLQIEVVGNTRRLRFAASLANVGRGPLLLLPRGEADAGRDSTRPCRWCIEMPTGTGNFSVPATGRKASG
jgi:hypothetical protein